MENPQVHTNIIERKSKRTLMSYFFAFYFSFLLVIGIVVLRSQFNWMSIVFCCCCLILSILGIRLLLWLLIGKEKIIFDEQKIVCQKTGTFFVPEKIILAQDLKKFVVNFSFIEQVQGFDGVKGKVSEMSNFLPYFRVYNKGRIRIVYGNKTFSILNNLSSIEGRIIANKLNEFYHLPNE